MIPVGENLPYGWQWKKLGQICDFLDSRRIPLNNEDRENRIRGKSISELYPYYGANGQVGWIDSYIFDEPLILLAEDGGHFGSTDRPIAYAIDGKTWVNNHAHVLRPKNGEINFHYCLYALMFRPDVEQLISGSTRGKLNQEAAAKIPIPLPPMDEQKRIAGIIEEADYGRHSCGFTQSLSHTFLQETFVDMFGNPVTNPMGWEIKRLGDLLTGQPQNGLYVPEEDYVESHDLTGIEMVHMSDLFYEIIERGRLKRVRGDYKNIDKYFLHFDDLLIARRSLNYEGAAKPCRIPLSNEPLVFESSMIRIRPDKSRILPIYLFYYLSNQSAREAHLYKYVTISTISGINQDNLQAVEVIVPPLELQQQFAEFIQEHERVNLQQQESARQAEHLFQTLLHRAFRGEL